MKTIRMSLNPQSIDKAIKELEAYNRDLKEKSALIVQRLADIGLPIARAGFQTAVYDGTNDVQVTVEDNGEARKAIVATGSAVLFIEFGTGVTYPDNHPKKPDGIVGRGEYGKGRGKRKTWGYYGEPGTNGEVREKNGKQLVLTHGNPANMAMYNTKERLEQEIARVAKEVFGNA